jgi:stress response protein SCP2
MAYVTAQWNILAMGVGGAPSLWTGYGTDVHTDVDAADFVSDGSAKGMKVGDFVLYYKTSATKGATLHSVEAVTAGGAATLSPAILA